ncbi:MAG: hypothetical protein HYV14_04540 [Elusimicrobia bacterium]|nr:hypothetical protein [Elusimicrobiota bacterium]
MMRERGFALFAALVLAAASSARPAAAQALVARCDAALAAADEMLNKVAECSSGLQAGAFEAGGGPAEAQLLHRIRSYAGVAGYLEDVPNPCAKLADDAVPRDVEQCQVFFRGLRGGAAACKKLPAISAVLCRDAAAYALASKAGNSAACGRSARCRVLMGEAPPAAPAKPADFRGFVCQAPIQSPENWKAVNGAISHAQLCLTDLETAMAKVERPVALALDERAERLARLRLSLNAHFAAAETPGPRPARAP